MKHDLELVVDEPIPGHFYWTIVWRGQPGDLPRVIDYARGPLPTHNSASSMGAAALRMRQTVDSEATSDTARMLSGLRVEWCTETVPGKLG